MEIKAEIKAHWLTRAEIDSLGPEQNSPAASDPVRQHLDKWYYWDEVWMGCCGPFETQELATADLGRYCYAQHAWYLGSPGSSR